LGVFKKKEKEKSSKKGKKNQKMRIEDQY
jgi:hypothetical protein